MMSLKLELIKGGLHHDERGTLSFVNDFRMQDIKRFYVISHPNDKIIRAWQGHKIENKWFYCISGSFMVNVVEIDHWDTPSPDLKVQSFVLNGSDPAVLKVGGGCVTGLKALTDASSMMVFSDMDTVSSKEDDFRFDINQWFNWDNS